MTLAYRGRFADLTRVEDFEDRVLDFALAFGGQAQIWRSAADDAPQRLVRGVLLNLAPGQETTSLLLSPEGWLLGLTDIEDAEQGLLSEPPWCFTKTQFGPLEGHVALVEMFTVLKREFLPDLEVSDEGGYWETRDLPELIRRRTLIQAGSAGLAEGLRRHSLSAEAAEDPAILLRRIERIAAQVCRGLGRPAEHPPVTLPDESEAGGVAPSAEATEALWDEMFKHNRRQQERLTRAIEERRQRGEEDEEAFENALRDLGLETPDEEPGTEDEPWCDDEAEPDEAPFPDNTSASAPGEEEPVAARHPLLERAKGLLKHLHEVFRNADAQLAPALQTLFQGAGDTLGGLAQALPGREYADDVNGYGLRVTQLKRALRGIAFARGALFSLRPAVAVEQHDECSEALRQMEEDVFQQLGRLRSEYPATDAEG
jgi:hypothetical protein